MSMSFRGNLISKEPIDPKIGLNVGYGVVYVQKAWFLEILIASCKFMQFAFFWKQICVHRFDWSTNPILLKIDIHVRFAAMHVWSNWFLKKYYWYSCKFMQLAIFCKYICAHGFDWSTNPFLLKIDIHVRYTMMHVWNNRLAKDSIGNYIFMQYVSCLKIYLCARFWLIY